MGRGSRAAAGVLAEVLGLAGAAPGAEDAPASPELRLALSTHPWGRDWDLATLLRNCQFAGVEGVELRAGHAHGVDPDLGERGRAEARLRFRNAPVELLGLHTGRVLPLDPDRLRAEVAEARRALQLAHDVDALGVTLRLDLSAVDGPPERAVERLAPSLAELGRAAAELGREIHLEADAADARAREVALRAVEAAGRPGPSVRWRCAPDAAEPFPAPGRTLLVHELDGEGAPYQALLDRLAGADQTGWLVLEPRSEPPNRIEALRSQRTHFAAMLALARARTRDP